jgi:hypothetical protein
MPVLWAIDHQTRTVVGEALGFLRVKDVEDFFEAITLTATLSYRKIFDMTLCTPRLSKEDLFSLSARVRSYREVDSIGPVAIVASSDESYEQASLFAGLIGSERLVKVFRERRAAHDWLDGKRSGSIARVVVGFQTAPTH